MSRVFSFRDLKLIPVLSQFTETELLNPRNDGVVNAALGELGFNLQAPILYVPSNHRDFQGKVGVGFRAVGEINSDPAYRNSRMCPIIERLIYAAQKDSSLAKELAKMIGHSVNLGDEAIEEDGQFPDEDVDPAFRAITLQIETLTYLRDLLRGSPYNEQGNLKTPAEYQ